MSLKAKVYCAIFSLRAFERYNDQILNLAIKVRGYNNYENKTVSGEAFFIENILPKLNPRICVDVGANVGDYSRILLQASNAKVFSFEPLAGPFQDLKRMGESFGDRFVGINTCPQLKPP